MPDASKRGWDVRMAEVHYRHEFRAADGIGQLAAHVFSAQGRTGWIVAEGCDLVAGAIVPGGNPTAWKTAREAADAAMAARHKPVAPPVDDDPTDAEIADLQADILKGWADRYGAETIEARLGALRPNYEVNLEAPLDRRAYGMPDGGDLVEFTPLVGNPPDDDLTDEQITEAAAYAAWADTFGHRDDEPAPDFDPLRAACFGTLKRRADG